MPLYLWRCDLFFRMRERHCSIGWARCTQEKHPRGGRILLPSFGAKRPSSPPPRSIYSNGVQEVVELDHSLSGKLLVEQSERFRSILQVDAKSYRSSNIYRVKYEGESAAATEYTTVGRLEFPTSRDLLFFEPFLLLLPLCGSDPILDNTR